MIIKDSVFKLQLNKLKNLYENYKYLSLNFFQKINFNQYKSNYFVFYPIIGAFTFPIFIILGLTLIGFATDGIRLGSFAAL